MPTPSPATSGTLETPKETPQTSFDAAVDQDPMRNFGFTVAAYSVIWLVALAFVLRSWMRQGELEARVASVEEALRKKTQSDS
ncbi:MAG: hypothetical protein U0165_13145 [Polyangiaceae bacterium]